ncbi:energy-coupling factor transport system ATP-binding protein [Paenibacillus phyllosphaerae]|uniref:Energy-coupling factor transport system ATP-binding protein n=1 Tax=Paenibacillus phyllosphaerae TaxID=274593 RepID=A0A7W5FP25_9BACL|nr:ATP-binding cassette domain-containing protein [Paenibacillus phyllosphaerae]MBB3111808.1 energy-coupling factor transport system ATP-binding protein [Paenibacillus phyllosphaerae]
MNLNQQEPIIEIHGLTFRYPGATDDVLRDVSLTIARGDFIAIAGGNGSGKSTLCKCLNGLIPNYYVGDFSGSLLINGAPAHEQTVSSLSRQVAYVFQDFENQLVRPSVYDEACFAPLNYGYADYRERGERALQLLGLTHLRDKWIWELSGGQKHMVALAGALSLDPDVIVVDEPVAQLDPFHARLIYDKLRILNEVHGKTIIVIEHHTEFIAEYGNTMLLMDRGRIRWVKPVREALNAISELGELHIEPPQVTEAFHRLRERTTPTTQDSPASSRPLYPVTLAQAADWLDDLSLGKDRYQPDHSNSGDDVSSRDKQTHELPQEADSRSGRQPLVRFEQVTYGYKDMARTTAPVLRGVNLTLYEGDRIALIGNNGAGKSTLMRLISGIRKPQQGRVTVCGQITRAVSPEELSDDVAFIFQNPEEMFIEDSIRKDVEYFLKARRIPDYEAFIEDIMVRFRLKELEQRDGRLMSGGQQRRATLAIGLAMRPKIMLLDEPTASLDLASRREMTELLDRLQDRVQTVIVATHDMQLVADWANRVIVMHNGQVALDTDGRTVFECAPLLEQAGLIPPQIVRLSHMAGISPVCLTVEELVARLIERSCKEETAIGSC